MDTESTVEAIVAAANTLECTARELRHRAKRLEETGNLSMSGDCINTITNAFNNLRLDLFVIRPLREYERIRRPAKVKEA